MVPLVLRAGNAMQPEPHTVGNLETVDLRRATLQSGKQQRQLSERFSGRRIENELGFFTPRVAVIIALSGTPLTVVTLWFRVAQVSFKLSTALLLPEKNEEFRSGWSIFP